MYLKVLALKIWKWLPLSPHCRWNIAWVLRQKFRVAVAAFIFDEAGRILLCEHTYRGYYAWGLPGGDLKKGEDIESGARREILEETGYEVEMIGPPVLHNSKEYPHISLIYPCRVASGIFRPNLEISRIHFFETDALPERILSTERQVILQAMASLSKKSHASAGRKGQVLDEKHF